MIESPVVAYAECLGLLVGVAADPSPKRTLTQAELMVLGVEEFEDLDLVGFWGPTPLDLPFGLLQVLPASQDLVEEVVGKTHLVAISPLDRFIREAADGPLAIRVHDDVDQTVLTAEIQGDLNGEDLSNPGGRCTSLGSACRPVIGR